MESIVYFSQGSVGISIPQDPGMVISFYWIGTQNTAYQMILSIKGVKP
jgi:hypothetical protein